jgi:DNA polymerase II small subunit/DNA polymerase delta subunit B
MSKKDSINTLISAIHEMNPGLPKHAKILCRMVSVSEFFDEIVGEVDDTDMTVWKVMFISLPTNNGHTEFVRGKRKKVRKMFDLSLD